MALAALIPSGAMALAASPRTPGPYRKFPAPRRWQRGFAGAIRLSGANAACPRSAIGAPECSGLAQAMDFARNAATDGDDDDEDQDHEAQPERHHAPRDAPAPRPRLHHRRLRLLR